MDLFVFAGPNGSGKSTFITSFLDEKKEMNLPYICPDSFFSYLYPNLKSTAPDYTEKYVDAMKLAETLRVGFVKNKISFSFETVLSREEKIDFIKSARDSNFKIASYFVTTESPNINLLRVVERVKNGGHDVPPEKIKSRYYKSMQLLKSLMELSDELSVYDNSGTEFCLVYQQDSINYYMNPLFKDKSWVKKYIVPYLKTN